jgi:hypothetical protein
LKAHLNKAVSITKEFKFMPNNKKPIEVTPENTMDVFTNSDGVLVFSSKDSICVDLTSIKSVGIENIVDIDKHEITPLFDSVSHYIKFRGKGEVQFSYNLNGILLELATTDVHIVIRHSENIIFRRMPD